MPRLLRPSNHASRAARLASRRWLLAGLLGGCVTATIAFADLFHKLPLPLDALATILAGAAAMTAFAPRRIMRTLTDDMPLVDELSQRVRALADGDRSQPLTQLILDRDDPLGWLTRAIHDLAAETVSTRSQSRLLHRRMDMEIETQTRKATAELEKQANTDPLTGLGNRREMEVQIDRLLRDRAGSQRQLTVMAIDLDRFKEVNDSLGHEVGDRCLVFLADLLRSSLRREDRPIRLGGDEFAVLLPDQTVQDAEAVAARLQTVYAMMPWSVKRPERPTLSIGAAGGLVTAPEQVADLLRQADDDLYAKKQARKARARQSAA